jgi:superoxide dismutase
MQQHELPELGHDSAALEPHLSARILELHHDKHNKAYVDAAVGHRRMRNRTQQFSYCLQKT